MPQKRGGLAESLPALIARLAELYSVEPPSTEPFGLILWENVGYLVNDVCRQALFDEFRARVGQGAADILRASDELLFDIARRGGMRPDARVARWRSIAELVLQECQGDLTGVLRALPPAKARSLLKRFPSIGDPGADKILLFCGFDARPSVDSNGLRVLMRLGFLAPESSYAATYKKAVALLARTCPPEPAWLISAYLVLREHGRRLCKRSAPLCMACPLDGLCAHAPAKGY